MKEEDLFLIKDREMRTAQIIKRLMEKLHLEATKPPQTKEKP